MGNPSPPPWRWNPQAWSARRHQETQLHRRPLVRMLECDDRGGAVVESAGSPVAAAS